MTTSPSQKFTSLWHAHKSRATFFKKLHAEFSSARARSAVFESRVLTLFFPTDEGLSTSRNVLKEHQKTSQCQTIILQVLLLFDFYISLPSSLSFRARSNSLPASTSWYLVLHSSGVSQRLGGWVVSERLPNKSAWSSSYSPGL